MTSFDLQQKGILITREARQAKEFASTIKAHHGKPFEVPLINIHTIVPDEKDNRLENIEQYEWLFFTSANGVNAFFEIWHHWFWDKPINLNIAAVGKKTNETLHRHGYKATFIPTLFNAKTMAAEFIKKHRSEQPILFIRGQLSSDVLPNAFTKAAIPFDCLTVYETQINFSNKEKLQDVLAREKIDFITLTSPSTVDAFHTLLENRQSGMKKVFVCIGTTTEKRAIELGFEPIIVPEQFTTDGMIQEINDYILRKGARS